MDDPNTQYDIPEREPPPPLPSDMEILGHRDSVRAGVLNIAAEAMEGGESYRDAVQHGIEEDTEQELLFKPEKAS